MISTATDDAYRLDRRAELDWQDRREAWWVFAETVALVWEKLDPSISEDVRDGYSIGTTTHAILLLGERYRADPDNPPEGWERLWNAKDVYLAHHESLEADPGRLTVFRILAPHFVAGGEAWRGKVVNEAPILKYMRGWSGRQVRDYCRRKGWTVERLPHRPAAQ